MQQHQRDSESVKKEKGFWNKLITTCKAVYFRFASDKKREKSKLAWKVYYLLRVGASRKAKKQQNKWFREEKERLVSTGRLMVFLVPAHDTVTGGIMSICNIADRSRDRKELHGCEVALVTMPGGVTITRFSGFENDWNILRYSQIESLFPKLEETYIQLPDICVADYEIYLKKHQKKFMTIPKRRLNILDQNIEVMPEPEVVRSITRFFGETTQTCAHAKYCTAEYRERYGIPTHLIPAILPEKFYQIPFDEKENLIAYSNDENPHKETVLNELKRLLPEYKFLMIENMSYDEYKKTISRAKWTLTFGEGWDAYFFQPYASKSIGFCVFNDAFCPPHMANAPTVFPDYETLPERMTEFIRTHDSAEAFEQTISEVYAIIFPPAPPEVATTETDPMTEFYLGHYTIP